MFSVEQFEYLHSLWDGGASNVDEVCATCFACCDNTEKIIFPGEAQYLLEKTGQHSSDWRSEGCMCKKVGTKLVFCKMYPMRVSVDLNGKWNFLGIDYGYISDNCKNLLFENSNFEKFLDFLFTDIHNILFHKLYTELDDEIVKLEKMQENQRLTMPVDEVAYMNLLNSVYKVLELPFLEL